MSLKAVYKVLNDLSLTRSKKEKEQILHKALKVDGVRHLKEVIELAYNPFKRYKVSKLPKPQSIAYTRVENLFLYLEDLANARGVSKTAIKRLADMANIDFETFSVISRVLKKDLRCGTGVKIFSQFVDIPQFNVQLANPYKPDKHGGKEWLYSFKYDGIRCLAIRHPYRWVLLTREGHTLNSCPHITGQLERIYQEKGYTFFDGELYLSSFTFEQIQGAVMRHDTSLEAVDLHYYVFLAGHYIPSQDIKTCVFNEDNLDMQTLEYDVTFNASHVINTHIGVVSGDDNIQALAAEAIELGYEGLMLRDKKKLYDFKRSNALLKVKFTETTDLKVTKVLEGEGKYKNMLGALLCEQPNGKQVEVGSGFSDAQRVLFWKNPPATIEIKYQNLTADDIARFPIFVRERLDK